MPRGQNISLTISPSISSSVTLSPFSKVLRAFAGKMVKLKNKKIANTPIEYLRNLSSNKRNNSSRLYIQWRATLPAIDVSAQNKDQINNTVDFGPIFCFKEMLTTINQIIRLKKPKSFAIRPAGSLKSKNAPSMLATSRDANRCQCFSFNIRFKFVTFVMALLPTLGYAALLLFL